jgi:hypothetical protein
MTCKLCGDKGYITRDEYSGNKKLKPYLHGCHRCGGQGCEECGKWKLEGAKKGQTHEWDVDNGFMQQHYRCPDCGDESNTVNRQSAGIPSTEETYPVQ